MSRPRLVGLRLGEDAEAWRRAGFTVGEDGAFTIGTLSMDASGTGTGVQRWVLANHPGDDVDGLPTSAVPAIGSPPRQEHPNGVTALDHLVIGSPNRERTIPVLEDSLGVSMRRQTEHRLYGRDMVQSFFLLPPTLLEVISRPDEMGDGPSVFWGLAFVVEDLDATVELLGDAVSPARDAVQPGRRIASLRHEDLGLSTPVAFLTPRPGRS